MVTARIVNHQTYPAHIRCLNCGGPLWTDDAWEVLGVAPVCGHCAGTCSKPMDRRKCEPCAYCGSPTPLNRFPDGMKGHICVPCYAARRPQSPAQSPGASHAPASATASASSAGAAAGDSRPWYDRPLLTAGLPIGVASLLLIAAAVDRVVDSGAPWHEVGEILSAMAPVLGTFAILLALCVGWMLRSLSNGLRDARDNGPEADAGLLADYNEAVEALKAAHSLIIRHHDCTVTRIEPGHFCPVCHRPDGSEPEIDQLHSAIKRHKNRR